MHDEATAHFVGMVDQTHVGHAFLRKLFGEEALPRVAWQIDPFGHSSTQASLLGAQVSEEDHPTALCCACKIIYPRGHLPGR